jgi:hypothetical protein
LTIGKRKRTIQPAVPLHEEGGHASASRNIEYPAPDPGSNRLLTAALLAGEAVAAIQHKGKASPTVTPAAHAAPEGGDLEPGGFDELLGLLDRIRATLDAEPLLSEWLTRLPAAFGNGDPPRNLFLNLFPRPPAHRAESLGLGGVSAV